MHHNKLLKRLSLLVFFILIVNYLAIQFYWYYIIWWFDMPMHFMGGLFLGLALLWIFRVKMLSLKSAFYIIGGVIFIGLLWEVYEVIVNNYFAQNPFDLIDTLSDLFFDSFGGIMSLVYFYYRIMPVKENNIE